MEDENENHVLQARIKYLEEQLRKAQSGDKTNSGSPENSKKSETIVINHDVSENINNYSDSDFLNYEKRSGTLDHGKEYEYLTSALYALKFSKNKTVLDFTMTTNNKIYGDFDDVEITVTFTDKTTQTFLIQLKHFEEKKKKITATMLTKEKENFSLLKYFDSFKTIKKNTNINCICILSTNINLALKNDSKFFLQNQEIIVKQREIKDLLLLDMTENQSCRIFQFQLASNENLDNKMAEFFDKFYLFTNQSNVKAVEASIESIICETLGCRVDFINFMHHWWKGNFVLSKHDVISKLTELALSPFTHNISNKTNSEKSALLKNAILKFSITIAKHSNIKFAKEIWGKTSTDVKEISKASLKYGITTKGFNSLDKLSLAQLTKALWYLNEIPLIVKFDESEKIRVSKAIRLLETHKKAKKLFLEGDISKEELLEWNVLQNLTDLYNLESFSDIAKKFRLSLQGREAVTLEQLIKDDSEIAKIIEVKELLIMSQEILTVSENKQNLPESYIPRSVSTTFLDIDSILDNYNFQEELLILNCNNEYRENIEHRNIDAIDLDYYLQYPASASEHTQIILTSTKEECSKPNFDEVCKQVNKESIYLLEIIDNATALLILSKNDNSALKKYKIEKSPIEEQKIYSILKSPVNAITAQPGIGKSTLTKYLSNNCPSNCWSIFINLIKHNSFLQEKLSEDELLSHFMGLENLDKDSFFYKVAVSFLKNRKIYLFLDGLDEIESSRVDLVLNFVANASTTGIKVWISSRNNLKEIMIKHLKIFPIVIEELDEDQQKRYIKERLSKKFEENQIEAITTTLLTSANVSNSQKLLGIPLQLYIITENYLNSTEFYPELDEDIFLLTKMYEIFFNGKRKHYYKKLQVDHNLLEDSFDYRLEQYELPALMASLDSSTFEKLDLDLDKSEKFLKQVKLKGDKFAIVNLVTEKNEAIFVHQTYAEYFACKWFQKNLDKLVSIKNEFFLARYQNLKMIFDIMLAEENPLHLATIYQNQKQFKKHEDKISQKDKAGRTPLHLICSHGQKFKKYFAPNTGETLDYANIFAGLLLKCDPFERDDLFGWNCLDYALQSECLYPFEAVLEKHPNSVDINSLLQRLDPDIFAFYCSYLGYSNLLNELIKRKPEIVDMRDHSRGSLLDLAVEGYLDNNDEALKKRNITTIQNLAKISSDGHKNIAAKLACENSDFVTIEILLENGVNVNSNDNVNTSMLYLVSTQKNTPIDVLELLKDHGADISAANSIFGNTALHGACSCGNYTAAKFLIANGARVNVPNFQQETPLHQATKIRIPSNADLAKMLIGEGADVDAVDVWGYTPLHCAAIHGSYDVVEVLLERGVSVNAVSRKQETALHNIAKNSKYDNTAVIDKLIDNGICVNAINGDGDTALLLASRFGNCDTVETLLLRQADMTITGKDGKSVLHCAILHQDVRILKLLIDKGANISARDKDGYTPLHEACHHGSYNDVKLLLEADADISATTIRNETLLHCATKREKTDPNLIQFLIDRKVDIMAKDTDGSTALHRACEYRNCDVIEALIKNGASVDVLDGNGYTSLHRACQSGDYKAIQILLDSGASAYAVGGNKETVLHIVLNREDPETELVNLLIDNNAVINASDNNGYTPLLLASEHGDFKTVELLLQRGADINVVTHNKETVLHLAVKRTTDSRTIKILIERSDHSIINTINNNGETVLYLSYISKQWKALEMLLDRKVILDSLTQSVLLEEFTIIFYEGRVKLIELILDTVSIEEIKINNDILPSNFPISLITQDGSVQSELLMRMARYIHKVRQKFKPTYCPDSAIIDYIIKMFQCSGSNEEDDNILQNIYKSYIKEPSSLLLPVSFMDEMKKILSQKKINYK